MVTFDASGKIIQVRQNWDQGSLLKLIDVIGKTGRNWPIQDGKDQIKLITSSVKSAGKSPIEGARPPDPKEIINKLRENSTNVTRDPHASLSLFAPRDQNVENSLPAVVAPRASAKPPPRDYSELFVGNDSDNPPSTAASPVNKATRDQTESPSKFSAGIAPKGGAGRNYQPIRLFETDENSPVRPSPERDQFYRPNPKKYQHFDLADSSDPQDAPKPAPAPVKTKHGSQWTFDDFMTPDKVVPSKVLRGQEVRHWGTENDEVLDSPIRQKKVDKPRKDAETHFEFVDDGTPEGTRRVVGRPRGAGTNTGLGLYRNNLYGDDGLPSQKDEPRVLGPITNVKDRHKDFDPHFNITDESPAGKESRQPDKLPDDKLKAVRKMDASWETYDQSPVTSNQKENATPVPMSPTRLGMGKGPLSESTNTMSSRNENSKGIAIGGDGMGGRKGMSNRNDNSKGIAVGGDGMGGKKGTGRGWGIGDDSDGEEAGGLNGNGSKFRKEIPGKKQGSSAQTGGGDFWDF
jgi:hypothetical protein